MEKSWRFLRIDGGRGGELNRGLIRGLVAPIHPPTPNKQSPPLGVVVVVGPEKPKDHNTKSAHLLSSSYLPTPAPFFLRSSLFAVSFCLPTLPTFSSSCSDQTLFVFVPSRKKKKEEEEDDRQTTTTDDDDDDDDYSSPGVVAAGLACLLACCFVAERARELSLLRLVCMHERAAVAQAMEGWSKSLVREWSNNNNNPMGGLESSCSLSSLFFQDSLFQVGEEIISKGRRSCSSNNSNGGGGGQIRPDQVLQGGCGGGFESPMKLAAAQQSLEVPTSRRRGGGLLLDGVLRSSSSSMVDSTSEVLAADDQDTMGSLVMPPHGRPLTSATSGVGACLQQQLRAESGPRLQFCVAPESPAGPLSRGESEESLGGEPFFNANSASCGRLGSSTMGLKRQLEDADKDAWMDLRAQKSPKLLPQEEKALVFQDHNHSTVYGSVPSSFGVSYLNPTARSAAIAAAGIPNGSAAQSASLFAAAAPPGLSHEIELGDGDNLPNKVASMRAILFRASLPLPTAAEIESSRPKRRNVRISKDPQSVAARHRRERISDRIRVLQRLVPGGTKMDTASMLDEAIHYVKFLKLQLQTLEQLGNGSCDLRYNGAIGGQSSLVPPTRPFDLNCAVYNQVTSSCEPGAPLVATVSLSTDSPATSHLSSEVWPSATSVSRHFGGPGQFSDPLQEQFCH